MADSPEKPDRFKPSMQRIPGVADAQGPAPPEKPTEAPRRNVAKVFVPLAAVLLVGAVIAWWMLRGTRPAATTPGETPASSFGEAPPASASPVTAPPAGPAVVATLEELANPWASKKFLFRKRLTNEVVPAVVVRLPGGAANQSASYWAFSLQAPFERCELEYVTDLNKLAEQYGYRARHPMVGDPCTSTLYDPLRMGTLPGGAWASGEVVQGSSIRPPMAVEVRVEADRLIASQTE
jgi:hypothetical protein